jgi:RNA polymerase sigma factor (sigma-70 family)
MAPPPSLPENTPPTAADADVRALMVQYGPALRRYFSKRAAPQDIDDLVQNVFLKLQARSAVEPVDNIEGYLFRTAANVLVDEHRQDTLGLRQHAALSEDLEPVDDFSPERILIGQENLDRIMAAVQALPPRVAEAFIFHRFEEMTYDAIARRMGITRSAVEKLIMRALDRLMLSLERSQ